MNMENLKNIIIKVILGFLIFIVGGGVGNLFAKQTALQKQKDIINTLDSSVVRSIYVSGRVAEITSSEIIVSNGSTAQIKLAVTKDTIPYMGTEKITIDKVKVGDVINGSAKIVSDGTLEFTAFSVMQNPAKTQTNNTNSK